MKRINRILLVDDDEPTNFLNKHIINKYELAEEIVVKHNGAEALEYLTSAVDGKYPTPDIILLDINMPVMDGWEFIDEYKNVDEAIRAKVIVFMLTTSLNPDDEAKAATIKEINAFLNKPLTQKEILEIFNRFFD